MRVRTTNNRLVGFAYKPGSSEEAELIAGGMSAEKAASHQYFEVTPEGVDLPERVGAYALNLYSTQIKAVGNEARVAAVEPVVDSDGSFTNGSDADVDISGEEDAPLAAMIACARCDAAFTAKTFAAAKGKLTRHTKKEHGG